MPSLTGRWAAFPYPLPRVRRDRTRVPEAHPGPSTQRRAHDAVINATIALLTHAGYPGLSIERIAATGVWASAPSIAGGQPKAPWWPRLTPS